MHTELHDILDGLIVLHRYATDIQIGAECLVVPLPPEYVLSEAEIILLRSAHWNYRPTPIPAWIYD